MSKILLTGSFEPTPFPDWDLEGYGENQSVLDTHAKAYRTNYDPAYFKPNEYVGSEPLYGWGRSSSGILAPNGKIYMPPRNNRYWAEFNPETNIITNFGPDFGTASAKLNCSALGNNGKIYALPSRIAVVSECDPTTNTITNFGDIPGLAKWTGAVRAPNGAIYGSPQGAGNVIKVVPETQTISYVGPIPGGVLYRGIVLGLDGKLYCVPDSAAQVLVVDPTDDSFEYFGDFSGMGFSSRKWEGGVLAPNGKIYCMPAPASIGGVNQLLIIHPNRDLQLVPFPFSCFSGAVGTDGFIYGVAGTGSAVFRINPKTDEIFTYPTLGSPLFGSLSHMGAVLGLDGAVYAMSFTGSYNVRLTSKVPNIDPNWPLAKFFTKAL